MTKIGISIEGLNTESLDISGNKVYGADEAIRLKNTKAKNTKLHDNEYTLSPTVKKKQPEDKLALTLKFIIAPIITGIVVLILYNWIV